MVEFDVAWIAILIAGISAGGVIGGFFINWKRLGHENKLLEIKAIKDIHDELTELSNKISLLKTKNDVKAYAHSYLNSLMRLVWMLDKELLPKDTAIFFQGYLSGGLTLRKWYYDNISVSTELWSELVQYCKVHDIQPINETDFSWLTKIKNE